MRPSRTLLIPAVGLVLVLGLAVGVTLHAAGSPEARVYGEVVGYLDGLYEGNPHEAARRREDGNPTVEAGRAESRRGRKWFVAAQEVRAGLPHPEARIRVLWLTDEDVPVYDEVQIWRPGADGRWRLWAFDGGATGPHS